MGFRRRSRLFNICQHLRFNNNMHECRQSDHKYGYKKKELIGNLYRDGELYTLEFQDVYDHDFSHLADGIIISHGIYDVI
jgi:hypothetical protein